MSCVSAICDYLGVNHLVEDSCFQINLDKKSLFKDVSWMKSNAGLNCLIDITAIDLSSDSNPRFKIIYHFLNMYEHERFRIYLDINSDEVTPSISTLFSNALGLEQEIYDMFGLYFHGIELRRFINPEGFKGYPLRKDFNKKVTTDFNTIYQPVEKEIPIQPPPGLFSRYWHEIPPTTPGLPGPMRILLELEGEDIISTICETGFSHRGLEKICEESQFSQIPFFIEKLDANNGAVNRIAWFKLLEELHGVDIPIRAKALRMVFMELSRVLDHLSCISLSLQINGNQVEVQNFQKLRYLILSLFQSYSGKSINIAFAKFGGLEFDVPNGWISNCLKICKTLTTNLLQIDKSLNRNYFWMQRNKVGKVKAEDALNFSMTGPNLRACGVSYDLRKTSPYYLYSEVDFEVPLGVHGNGHDRYLVRIEEIYQSINIIQQILDGIPSGEVISYEYSDDEFQNKIKQIPKDKWLSAYQERFPKGKGDFYSFVESGHGEFGIYISHDSNGNIQRLRMRTPSSSTLQIIPQILNGQHCDDSIFTISSLYPSISEVDR